MTVTVYTKPACVQCNATYKALDKQGVAYDVIDITESPELTELVQHVVDRVDYRAGNAIGLVLFPDTMEGWVNFRDSSAGTGHARLRVEYRGR